LFPILVSYQTLTAADQPTATLAEALTSYQHGNFDAAVDMYREILKLDSKNSDAYAGLTRTFRKQRKLEEVRATIDQAVKIVDSPSAYGGRGGRF
jgi:Flp pilus assembly protein TadD